MDRKFFGIEKNIAFCLAYLIPIIGLLIVLLDTEANDDEKLVLWQAFFIHVIASVTCGLGYVLSVIGAIQCYHGNYALRVPIISDICNKIIGR